MDTPEGVLAQPPSFAEEPLPEALTSYQGLVLWEGSLYLAAYARDSDGAPSLLALAPMTDDYLAGLLPDLGVVEFRDGRSNGPAARSRVMDMARAAAPLNPPPSPPPPALARMPPPAHPFDWVIRWPAQTKVLDWRTGAVEPRNALALRTRPSAVFRHVMSKQSAEVNAIAINLGRALAILFGVALLISTVVAVSLTRTVTGAIHDLYVGTRQVDRGNFSYRAPTHGYTQLTELARSFNAMTPRSSGSSDSRERERLEAELQIAHEVQAQLFPRFAPRLETLEALGVCKPAQSVSGDFCDCVAGDRRLALSFGDVSGRASQRRW